MEAVLGSLRNLSSGSGVAVVRLLLELPTTSALMPEAKVTVSGSGRSKHQGSGSRSSSKAGQEAAWQSTRDRRPHG